MFNVNILTLFPEMFPGTLGQSIAGKALEKGLWSLNVTNIRDFAKDKHNTVDDSPYGGGAGMVMRADVLGDAIDSLNNKPSTKNQKPKLIYMSPRGKMLTQKKTEELLVHENLAIICGRYEGIDQRVIDNYDVEEISVGDFVLSGGEIAAFLLIDACIRQIDGVLSNPKTLEEESFGEGKYKNLLEYPLYTRPEIWRGSKVPSVLLSGNHKNIEDWRLKKSEEITENRRPDLWERYNKDN